MTTIEAHSILLIRNSSNEEKKATLQELISKVESLRDNGKPADWDDDTFLAHIDEILVMRSACYNADHTLNTKFQEVVEEVCDKHYRKIGSAA